MQKEKGEYAKRAIAGVCRPYCIFPFLILPWSDGPVVQWRRRLPDTEEIGGSIPPGTTSGVRDQGPGVRWPVRLTPDLWLLTPDSDGLPDLVTGLAWNASEPQGLVGSTPTPSAVSVV